MCCMAVMGIPHLYRVAQSRTLLTSPKALAMSISIIAMFSIPSRMDCSSLIIASMVDSPLLYPNCVLNVTKCSILDNLFVWSLSQILYMICVRHIGR